MANDNSRKFKPVSYTHLYSQHDKPYVKLPISIPKNKRTVRTIFFYINL